MYSIWRAGSENFVWFPKFSSGNFIILDSYRRYNRIFPKGKNTRRAARPVRCGTNGGVRQKGRKRMITLDLNGKWRMRRCGDAPWTDAKVPGSVYSALLDAGKMEDPFYRDNEYEALKLSDADYEFERDFEAGGELLGHERVLLRCEGLDTLCELSLNGRPVGSTRNMHRTYEFDVKPLLRPGRNVLRALFRSPVAYIRRMQAETPLWNSDDALPGISHIRKAHCMFGWDWGPKLPDMGIWRSISLRGYDKARLGDVYITQRHTPGSVALNVRVTLEQWGELPAEAEVKVTAPDGAQFAARAVIRGGTESIPLIIENPSLWWPHNYGGQPLYRVEVTLLDGNAALDARTLRIGLRTLTVERKKDEWGESFCFVVNGVRIFSMGGDYIPEDSIFSRGTRERTERLIQSCVAANYNSIRVWGGGVYPSDDFYDLCDEYGLVVWQDLMYACGVYDFSDDFADSIAHETVDNMRRLRHHASLGLWCGNNEMEEGWCEWGWSQMCPPKYKADYIKQFEVLLPSIAKREDPETFYWLASPSSGGSFDAPNDESRGDMHYWEVWHGRLPFTAYRKIFPRFMSEFGLQSFPGRKTVETFTRPGDRNIFSYVMESHQKNSTCNEKILYYIGENYKLPKDFDSLLYASQLIQAEGLRYGVEHWRRNRGRCMGAIYWQLNDCWPVASWSSIDYFGRWKALHYAARRFFAPVLLSACEEGTDVSLHLSNERLEKVSGTLAWALRGPDGALLDSGETPAQADPLSSHECLRLDFSGALDTAQKRRNAYLAFSFTSGGETLSAGTVLFVKAKHFSFLAPKIGAEIAETDDAFRIRLTAGAFARFVELDLREADGIFDDNYFDLTPGEEKTVTLRKANLSRALTAAQLEEQLTVRSLYDTYED